MTHTPPPSVANAKYLAVSGAALAGCVLGMWPAGASAAAPAVRAAAQAINNDYGQSVTTVNAEIAAQVGAVRAVKAARASLKTLAAKTVIAKKAESAARAALAAAKKKNNSAAIAAATTTLAARVAATKKASAAQSAQAARTSSLVRSWTAKFRAHHYRPVDGTYTGKTFQYFIPEVGLEPIAVRITVFRGHVSDVAVPVYESRGDSGNFNAYALPRLKSEAMAANDTAKIATVSGATLTGGAFKSSLQNALTQAGFKG
jgi:uncharacterized protein with FMN-binding domain